MVASGLTVGNTYYMRVYDYRTQYAWQDPSYDLCVVEGLGSGVGVEEGVATNASTSIYPNPANGWINVRLAGATRDVHVSVIDACGRVLLSRPGTMLYGQMRIDIGTLAPGMYSLRLETGSSTHVERFVIE